GDYRLAIAHSRAELPLAHRIHGAFVQPQPQALRHHHVLHLASRVDFHAHKDGPLQLRFARFFAVLRLGLPQQNRLGQRPLEAALPGRDTTIAARSGAGALSRADARAVAFPDAAAFTAPGGERSGHAVRVAELRQIQLWDGDL